MGSRSHATSGATGTIGRVYEVPRPLVYRAVDRLVESGLARPLRVEAGNHGPPRTVVVATAPGRRVARSWLKTPAQHVRNVRTELLVKLALLDRSGQRPGAAAPGPAALAGTHRGGPGRSV